MKEKLQNNKGEIKEDVLGHEEFIKKHGMSVTDFLSQLSFKTIINLHKELGIIYTHDPDFKTFNEDDLVSLVDVLASEVFHDVSLLENALNKIKSL